MDRPTGCRFSNRCPAVHDRCQMPPPVVELPDNQKVACWLYTEGAASNAVSTNE
ncbi:MAG: hypothetical protein U0528_20750 [Anaerolineae bacterium]